MKKLFLLLFTLVLFCCSSSNNEENTCFKYTITVESECGNTNTKNQYKVTETEYNDVIEELKSNPEYGTSSCLFISFRSLNNTQQQGYYKSGNIGPCD